MASQRLTSTAQLVELTVSVCVGGPSSGVSRARLNGNSQVPRGIWSTNLSQRHNLQPATESCLHQDSSWGEVYSVNCRC